MLELKKKILKWCYANAIAIKWLNDAMLILMLFACEFFFTLVFLSN